MSNLKNNPVPISDRRRQLIPGEFNLLVLALTPKGKPSGLKDHYGLNKINTGNILSFINHITTDKQVEGQLPIEIEIRDAEIFVKRVV